MNELEQLGLIRRRIFATSNDVLSGDEPLLQAVGFKGFTVAEQ